MLLCCIVLLVFFLIVLKTTQCSNTIHGTIYSFLENNTIPWTQYNTITKYNFCKKNLKFYQIVLCYCVVLCCCFFCVFLNYYETTQHNRYIQFHKFKRKNPSFFKNNTIHNSIFIFLENNTIHNTISSFWKQYYSPLNLLVGDLEIWFFLKTILFSLARNLIFFWKQYYSPLNLLVDELEIWFFFS